MRVESATRVGLRRMVGLLGVVAACGSSAGEPLAAAHWTASVPDAAPPGPAPTVTTAPAPTMISEEPPPSVEVAVLIQDPAGSVYEQAYDTTRLAVSSGPVDGNNTRIAMWP